MKPSFAATPSAIDLAVQPYDHYPSSSSASSSSSWRRNPSPEHHYTQPRHHHSSSSSSPSSSSAPPHYRHPEEYRHPKQHTSHHHTSLPYSEDSSRGHHHASQSYDAYPSLPSGTQRAYDHYTRNYHASSHSVKHTEGYEGRVRNTTRDQNDHLVTDSSVRDQQHHHDQYRRDPTYGFLKQVSDPSHPLDEDVPSYKLNLPPINVPEEPFYRSDMPGRHMRYFSNVTSQDRENTDGFFSSARHVAPSNLTGNFGHGPSINQTMEKFENARQRQLQQQQQQEQCQDDQPSTRLPSLYTALPEQRPSNPQRPDSRPPHPNHMPQQQQQRGRSPERPPVDSHANRGHHYHGYQQQQLQQQQPHHHHNAQSSPANRPKVLQPRSIAPAPTSMGPMSPTHPVPNHTSYHKNGAYSPERPSAVKIEPEASHYPRYQQNQQHYRAPPSHERQHREQSYAEMQVDGKRKWTREHSPVRAGPRMRSGPELAETQPSDEKVSQELHLLSRRGAAPSKALVPLQNGNHQRMRMQRYQMTTIRCWHGAIAQKSYGIEKRYLCPPPMVQVSAGLNARLIKAEQPHVTMSILHEKLAGGRPSPNNNENLEQDCGLDDSLKCSFRNLHVTGTGADSSKRFKLGLKVFLNRNPTLPTATMDSNPIPIISKPSKKTAKAGNASCFILNGMSVSLLNRINAQTVRTKYMAVDNGSVCAKIGSWSSFTIKMVKPPPAPPVKIAPTSSVGVFRAANHSTKFVPIRMKGENTLASPISRPMEGPSQAMPQYPSQHAPYHSQQPQQPQQQSPQHQHQHQHHQQHIQQEPPYAFSNSEPVLYGSEIILINDLTGVTTDRLIIRKVENGKVIRNGSGPVSQMQKIVLQHPERTHPEDGRPYYLSASSIGSPKIEGKIPLQAAMDRSPLLEYRTSSKKASIMDLTDAADDDEEEDYYGNEGGSHGQRGPSMRPPKGQESVAVDDFVCWTIAGIAKFDYTYFSPIPPSIDSEVNPRKVPTVLSHPRYNNQTNMLVIKVKNVFEKLSPAEEEARLRAVYLEDHYDRKLSLSEFVHRRCEDVKQPMEDEEGPIQLWLAQHGAVRMRRRLLKDVLPDQVEEHDDQEDQDEADSDFDEENDSISRKQDAMEDKLPKIPTKPNAASSFGRQQQQQQPTVGAHRTMAKRVKLLSRAMGLEAELPHGADVRTTHDNEGNAHAEMDILMVERATGIAYPTGYKIAYSRSHGSSEWTVEVIS